MMATPDPSATPRRLLIEDWMPARAVGIESLRERISPQAMPPYNFIHVWWARRPLAISRAAILLSLLPADADRAMVEQVLGFLIPAPEVVKRREAMDAGVQVDGGYGQTRLFGNPLPEAAAAEMHRILVDAWGETPSVLDPMAGGGSIPLEAARLGLRSYGSDYNPVAATVMRATVDHPIRFGKRLAERAKHWAGEWERRVEARLGPFMPREASGVATAYLFARTVPCPETGHPTPLVPDWSLLRPATVAVPVITDHEKGQWRAEIRQVGNLPGEIDRAPEPTYVRGGGRSLFGTRPSFSSDYAQAQAQAGRMGHVLYAVAVKNPRLGFRPPNEEDLDALARAEAELARLRPAWERDRILPVAPIPAGDKTREAHRAGSKFWTDLFAPRQLLAMGILVEELRRLEPEIDQAEGEMATALMTLLGFVVDKVSTYNGIMSRWEKVKQAMCSVFDRHDFSFKPSFAEMPLTVSGGGLEWAISNVLKASRQLAELPRAPHAQSAAVAFGSATSLMDHADGSVTAVVVDPPYYDNVQYSELADYFYVWLSRTIGHREPLWFMGDLCPNDDEGVANVEREKQKIRDLHGREPTAGEAKAAAHAYYEEVMRRTFTECRRVLRSDGVLTVMFTHTKQAAWVALATAIRDAGFTVTATWPVATESTTSLHIRDQNAAQSTVLLVARPRAAGAGTGLWAEVRPQVERAARAGAARLEGEGISGVDLLVGSFGPAIGVAAAFDRVQEATGADVPFDRVIEVAAGAVGAWRAEKLVARATGGGAVLSDADAIGRAVLVWWATFGRGTVGFDEALLLTRALGLDAKALELAGVAEKRGGALALRTATERRRALAATAADQPGEGGKVHPGDVTYATPLDALHAMAQAAMDATPLPSTLVARSPAPVVSEAGVGRARAIWNRLSGQQRAQAGALLVAVVAAAPDGARFGPGALDYPEFGLWRSLMLHFGLGDPPEWVAPPPPALHLPGFAPVPPPTRGRRRAS